MKGGQSLCTRKYLQKSLGYSISKEWRIYALRVHPFGKKDVALLYERNARDRGNKSKGNPVAFDPGFEGKRGCFSDSWEVSRYEKSIRHPPPHPPPIATFLFLLDCFRVFETTRRFFFSPSFSFLSSAPSPRLWSIV